MLFILSAGQKRFLSTPSARRATCSNIRDRAGPVYISIHALREEGDYRYSPKINRFAQFLSTPSARRATAAEYLDKARRLHFYPRPPRGGRLLLYLCLSSFSLISIHALREEGDAEGGGLLQAHQHFYPRPPRGGRPMLFILSAGQKRFLSTPSARRATCSNIRDRAGPVYISIHALREEGDYRYSPKINRFAQFLSTPSARRATAAEYLDKARRLHFYPRPPRGGRLLLYLCLSSFSLISIHALREEGDGIRCSSGI